MRIWVILDAGKGIYLFLYCLLLVALIRCFANHVQRAQLQHHLSQSLRQRLPPTIIMAQQFMCCRLSTESRTKYSNSIFLTPFKAIGFHQSKWQNWKVSSVQACRITQHHQATGNSRLQHKNNFGHEERDKKKIPLQHYSVSIYSLAAGWWNYKKDGASLFVVKALKISSLTSNPKK